MLLKYKKCSAPMRAFYCNVSSWRIKLTHYNETKKMAHDSQIVRAKKNVANVKLTAVFKTFVLSVFELPYTTDTIDLYQS